MSYRASPGSSASAPSGAPPVEASSSGVASPAPGGAPPAPALEERRRRPKCKQHHTATTRATRTGGPARTASPIQSYGCREPPRLWPRGTHPTPWTQKSVGAQQDLKSPPMSHLRGREGPQMSKQMRSSGS